MVRAPHFLAVGSRPPPRGHSATESKASDEDVIFVPTEEPTAGQSNAACSRRSATTPPAKPPASDRIESGGLKERRPLRSPRTSGGDVAAANRSASPRSPALRLPPAQPADHLERLQHESKLKDAAALHLPQTNNVDQLLDDVVDVENRELRFFDSMHTNGEKHLNALRDYLREESAEKHASRYSVDDYQLLSAEKCPKQMNGYDCGMFTCRFAEYVTRRAPFNFAQRHMAYFRKRTVFEIVNKELL
ncbi:ULP-PROTEASE domain-containing protein [Aphelenchoides fujianensis]|nr:ULP-PROTEASE domain-containing protein [Aphelenchoides fujianensis]